MQIEFMIHRGNTHEEDYRAQHMVWTLPDRTYETDWFPALVKVISGMIEDSDVDAEWTKTEDPDSYCGTCDRYFKSPSALKQHKTVTGHNGE